MRISGWSSDVCSSDLLGIAVDDAPFVTVEMKAEGDGAHARLAFRLNTGDMVTAGPDNPLRLAHGDDGPRPYLRVRGGLDALIARPIFSDLAARENGRASRRDRGCRTCRSRWAAYHSNKNNIQIRNLQIEN